MDLEPILVFNFTYNTFVELLLINRILFCDTQTRKPRKKKDNLGLINKLINENKNTITNTNGATREKSKSESKAKDILVLVAKHGVGNYLTKFYKDIDCTTIDLIFNNIIINKYPKQYQNEIQMKMSVDIDDNKNNDKNNDNSENKYQCLLFNQNDLIPNVFFFLPMNDICNCSKVNFVWLFHAFNVNSINYDNISFWSLTTGQNLNRVNLRSLQRFARIRNLIFDFRHRVEITDNVLYLMKCFGDLKKIEILLESFTENELLFFQEISKQCTKVEEFNLMMVQYNSLQETIRNTLGGDTREKDLNFFYDNILSKLAILELSNAKTIQIDSFPIAFICSNKCEKLGFYKTILTKNCWTQLIEKCDLSGVRELRFSDIDICTSNKPSSYDNSVEKQEISNKICEKMVNLKQIKINDPKGKGELILLNGLKNIIKKNNVEIVISFLTGKGCLFHFKKNREKILNNRGEIVKFLRDNKINTDIIVANIDLSSIKLATQLINIKEICKTVKKFTFSTQMKQNEKNNYHKNMDDYSYLVSFFKHFQRNLTNGSISFDELQSIEYCHLLCGKIEDLDLAEQFLTLKIDDVDGNKTSYEKSRYGYGHVLKRVRVELEWPPCKEITSKEV